MKISSCLQVKKQRGPNKHLQGKVKPFHLVKQQNLLKRPSPYNGHIFLSQRLSIHSLLFEPLYNGHFSTTATANCANIFLKEWLSLNEIEIAKQVKPVPNSFHAIGKVIYQVFLITHASKHRLHDWIFVEFKVRIHVA